MSNKNFPSFEESDTPGNILRLTSEMRRREVRDTISKTLNLSGTVLGATMFMAALFGPTPASGQQDSSPDIRIITSENTLKVAHLPFDIDLGIFRHDLEDIGYNNEEIQTYLASITVDFASRVGPVFESIKKETGIAIIGGDVVFFIELDMAFQKGDNKALEASINFLVELYSGVPMKEILTKHGYIKEV